MFLATQYYRAPFPNRRYWADDFARIRDAGLHAVQLWCLWGWIEAEPGVYRYDDYDELVALADKRGLKVVLSTIAEIHPFWIHRLVPGSEMVDHLGRKVVSCCRVEANVGLTPGGCFDHPRVAELMRNFLTDIASRYAGAGNLIGWDCWNETRWCVHADGHVCYCPHTLREFRNWLAARHGDLPGLSAAWQRRYDSWQDVYPGKHPGLPFTDIIEFERFLVDRATGHMRMRYEAIRAGDDKHLISAHCGQPAVLSYGSKQGEQSLCRGVDWDLADQLDGFGCSHFPFWSKQMDECGFGLRVEASRSANRGKVVWVSELQGGAANCDGAANYPVQGAPQQRWVVNGMARGAKGVIFWCWRDEVFGRESSGFGLSGWDGLAGQRLAAMKKTAEFIDRNDALIEAYKPDAAKVGVLFVPDSHMLSWAQSGTAEQAVHSVAGYATALERLRMPYEFVEAHHLDVLEKLDVLLMPWSLIVPPQARRAIVRFIRRGGRVLTEAETDAFDELGFYRYPDERPFMKALGVHDLGRRKLASEDETLLVRLGEEQIELALGTFTTPLKCMSRTQVLAVNECDEPLAVRQPVGRGAAYVVGSFLGQKYYSERNEGLERLIRQVCDDAAVRCDFDVDAGDGNDLLQWRSGRAGARRLLWIINGGSDRNVTVIDQAGRFHGRAAATELLTQTKVTFQSVAGRKRCCLVVPAGSAAVLRW